MARNEHNAPPAGTGYAPGLGEAFNINLGTGQGTYVYQMPLPEGVAKLTPKLSLNYAHGATHGIWGLGWRMGLRAISVRLDFGTPDSGLTERYLDSGMEIAPSSDGTYRTMREALFSRYTRLSEGWKVEDRNGTVHELGLTAEARISDPEHPTRTVEWLLECTRDSSGNEIRYSYRIDGGFAYPDIIRYAIYEVRFHYEDRPDIRQDGRAGFSRRRALRCSSVDLILDPGMPDERSIRSWHFGYELCSGSGVSILSEIGLTARGKASDGSEDVHRPSVRFQYAVFEPEKFRVRWMKAESGLPPALSDPEVALVTLDNAPLPGVLQNRNGREYYWANVGNGEFASPRPLPASPMTGSFDRRGLAFVDMDGSGTADLMVADPDRLQGFYENGGREGWLNFVAFPRGKRSSPTWTNTNLRLMDVDGDGLTDAIVTQKRAIVFWRNEGREGWTEPFLIPKKAERLVDVDFSDPDVYLADMSGDGLQDIVKVQSGRVEYWPNLGRGRYGAPVLMHNAPRVRRNGRSETMLLADLDGDGCADLVFFTNEGLVICQNQNGCGFADPLVIDTVPMPLGGTLRAINLNGRAGSGLLWNSPSGSGTGYVQFEFAQEQPPYVMNRVENGAGLVSVLRYRSAVDDYSRDRLAGRRWTTNFPFPYLVVASTHETDTVSGRVTEVEFRYHEAHFDRHTRQFQGFRQTERIEKGDGGLSRHDTLQIHSFLMAQELKSGNGPEHANLNGLLESIAYFDLDGTPDENKPMKTETSLYGLDMLENLPDGRKRCFVYVKESRTDDTERTADVRAERKQYTYDAVGNVICERLTGSGIKAGVEQPLRERTTTIEYATSVSRYLVNKPSRSVTRDGNGVLLAEKRWCYDGDDFTGLPLGEVDRGLVSCEQIWVLTQDRFEAHYVGMDGNALGYLRMTNADGIPSVFAPAAQSRYNEQGLIIATRDAFGAEARMTYDASGLFRVKLNDTMGETGFTYDRATSQVLQTVYPDGSVSQYTYDAQGRILSVALPGQTLAEAPTSYSYDESVIPNRRIATFKQSDGTTSTGVTYYDGYGKEFQYRVEVDPGQVLVSALRRVNPWGDLYEEFEPTLDSSLDFELAATAGRPSRKFFYDGRGRAIRTINFNNGISTVEFRPFQLVTRDANDTDDSIANIGRGQYDTPHIEEFDVLRYLVRVTEVHSLTRETSVSYEVGPMGELLKVIDSRGEKFSYKYDQTGCRLAVVSQGVDERKFWYDAQKRLVASTDGAGNHLTAAWDAFGRMTEMSSGGVRLESYQYDVASQNAFGKLAEVQYPGGRQKFFYDLNGRLIRHDFFHDGTADPYSVRYEYDSLGRETACVHPDGTRVMKNLTNNGWVRSMPGLIDMIQYDPRGMMSEIKYANGVKTQFFYTPGPGKIKRQITIAPGDKILEDVSFGFDKMEMMLSSNDIAPGGAGLRKYTYDSLYQLTSMESIENGAPVRRVYDYTNDYNLGRHDESGCTLRYEDAVRPDRMTSFTPQGGTRFDVSYDGNGNLLDLPDKKFVYNVKNELVQLIRADGLTATYCYDHSGQRISKQIDDGQGNRKSIRYIGEIAEIRNENGGADEVFIFVRIGNRRVAVKQDSDIQFLHENATGSTTFVTDSAGQQTGKLDFLPFGNEGRSVGAAEHKTFALHPVDVESGLVYMKRRYYSPSLGRFLTPDLMAIYRPEECLHSPQRMHLYAYVANDPLNKTDPTGLSFWSVLGAVVGVIAGVALGVALVVLTGGLVGVFGIAGLLMGIGLIAGTAIAVVGVSYLLASASQGSDFGEFMRGFMIGFNAGMNGVLATALFGPFVGVALGVVNFLAAFDTIAQNSVYQGILGWTSWLMPMSWLATGVGLIFFVLTVIPAIFTLNQVDAVKIESIDFNWRTGTFMVEGGWMFLPGFRGGYNLGQFVYITPGSGVGDHEVGHALSNAAFGSFFHFIGAIDENAIQSSPEDAYAELIAESHGGGSGVSGRPVIPMWS